MSAVFKENKDSGKRELEKMEATGNVKITTEEEVLKGRKASYTSASNIARIIGNVSIARGENILLGEEAEVNLATNISRLFGAPQTSAADSSGTALPDDGSSSSSGRVRGVFYPGGDKAPRITPVTESETDG